MPDVRVSVMLLLCGASENELISHHKNIQEGTSSWNLSAPRSCYAGSNRQSEEAEGEQRAVVCVCLDGGWEGFELVHEHMVFSVFISDLSNEAEFFG